MLIAAVLCAAAGCAAAAGENSPETQAGMQEEAGLTEIQGILDIQPVGNIDGMDLEMLTSALSDNVMSEYYDPLSGFRMQYPSVLQFAETEKGAVATNDSGQIRMMIESTPDGSLLTVGILVNAVRMEDDGAEIREYTDPACVLKEKTDNGEYRIDLYTLSGDWLHHITLTCPEEEKDSITPFVEYMIHSMTSDDGLQG